MDEILIGKARSGNQEALAQLLYLNYEFVYRYLVKFTLNVNIAEDLTQETMVKAIEKFHLYIPEKSKFSTWLIAIAQNIYLDGIRKHKREQKYIETDGIGEEFSSDSGGHDDSWNRMLDELTKLSEEVRIPLVMKHYYGYSYEEIAVAMQIPLGTVKSRIHNGLKSLRKEFEHD
ncbi:MAG: RNA polymerase sigma factor SigY [Clostridia bacterium]|nr:RNA polymerase sigma factor SigY [Clostridia bacterium]